MLVVDDEPAWVSALGAVLGKAGHKIVAAYDGEEAVRRFRARSLDAGLLDLAMPDSTAPKWCRSMRAQSDMPILIVRARVGGVRARQAARPGRGRLRAQRRSVEPGCCARIRAVVRRHARRKEWRRSQTACAVRRRRLGS